MDDSLRRAGREIAFGSVAGMLSKTFEHPFDLTKVRLQSQVLHSSATLKFAGPVDCLRQTWRREGFRGLYRGLPAPVVGAMAENASLFLSYLQLQTLIRHVTHREREQALPLHLLALAAAGSGTITSFFLTPIELVKCKMQVQMLIPSTTSPLPGPLSIFTSILRTHGPRGLWLGHTGTLIRETGGTAAWFTTKEYVSSLLLSRRRRLRRLRDGDLFESTATTKTKEEDFLLLPWESALSGAIAGVTFNLALFPADTVKSAMQTHEELRPLSSSSSSVATQPLPPHPSSPSPQPPLSSSSSNNNTNNKPTFSGTLKAIYAAQGLRGFYAGCGITLLRSIPSNAIIFLVYDGLKKHF